MIIDEKKKKYASNYNTSTALRVIARSETQLYFARVPLPCGFFFFNNRIKRRGNNIILHIYDNIMRVIK